MQEIDKAEVRRVKEGIMLGSKPEIQPRTDGRIHIQGIEGLFAPDVIIQAYHELLTTKRQFSQAE